MFYALTMVTLFLGYLILIVFLKNYTSARIFCKQQFMVLPFAADENGFKEAYNHFEGNQLSNLVTRTLLNIFFINERLQISNFLGRGLH